MTREMGGKGGGNLFSPTIREFIGKNIEGIEFRTNLDSQTTKESEDNNDRFLYNFDMI